MRLRPWIVGALALAVLLAAGLVALVSGFWLRSPLEARLSEAAGAQIAIDGPIRIALGRNADIKLRHVRLWTPDFPKTPLARIDELDAVVDLRQLRHGHLVIPEITLVRPVVSLVRDAKGGANWRLGSDQTGDSGDEPTIGRLAIVDGKLSYIDVPRHTNLDASVRSVGETLLLDGTGTYEDQPSIVRATGGPAIGLLHAARPYRISANAVAGTTALTGSGTITHPFATIGLDLDITAEGRNAEELFPILSIPAPPTPPYHLAGKLDRTAEIWQLTSFAGTVGNSDLGGSLRFETRRDRLLISGSLSSKTLDIKDLGLIIGAAPGAGAPAGTGRILPDAPLNLDEIRDADVDVAFTAGHLTAEKLPLEDVDAHVTLDNALLVIAPLKVGVAGGLIDARLTLDARQNDVTADYDIQFRNFLIDRFLRSAGIFKGDVGTIEGRIAVRGTGDSVQQTLATADGRASVFVNGAAISSLTADLLGLDVTRALGLLVTGNRRVPVRCFVADLAIKGGVLTPDTLLLETDTALVTGTGRIDLGSERLDLRLTSVPRHARGLALGTPISIGGTFQRPTLDVTAGTIARGTASAALGLVLSPLGAIADFVGGSDGRQVDCTALKRRISAASPARRTTQ